MQKRFISVDSTRNAVTKQYNLVLTGQGLAMPCGWEGKRRSGVALVMRHTPVVYLPMRSRPKSGI